MAISGLSVFEVRPTVGTDTNGGGFVPGATGTDYSQQNSKNTVGTDISATDAVANGTAVITSATANFGTSIVGNIVYMQGGTGTLTAGWYQVTARASSTSITVDRNVATGTGITINIGGALATLATAWTASIACNTIYVKATGSLTVTATLDITRSSGASFSGGGLMKVIGYTTTRGDNGRFTWTTATNSTPLITLHGCGGLQFQNINFTTSASTKAAAFFVGNNYGANNGIIFDNCVMNGLTYGVDCAGFGNTNNIQFIMHNCEIKNCTVGAFRNNGGIFVDCYIHDNTGIGIETVAANPGGLPLNIIRCVIYNNTSTGVLWNGTTMQFGCMILESCIVSNGGDGVYGNQSSSGNGVPVLIQNCIICFNGGFGIRTAIVIANGNLPAYFGFNNAFYSNSSGPYSTGLSSATDITLTGDPFTSKATGDFSLNSTAGAGAACKTAAFASSFF